MKVLKFGGSSVGNPERIKTVVGLIVEAAKVSKITVVISAFQGVTDQLLKVSKLACAGAAWEAALAEIKKKHISYVEELSKHIKTGLNPVFINLEERFKELADLLHGIALLKQCSPRAEDTVVAFGELLSCSIIAAYGKALGHSFAFVDARELICTDATYNNARVDFEKTNVKIQSYCKDLEETPIITGFIGRAPDGSTTTLGRSGSDYTASIVGAALDVSVIEIWTDVDGVMTADPRMVQGAFVLPKISYQEAMEMAHFGAKVIHPQTVQPAVVKKIPLLIKNTFNPDAPGTLISEETTEDGLIVKGITSIDDCVLVTVEGAFMIGTIGSAVRVLKAFANKRVNIMLMTQSSSEYTICLGIKKQDVDDALRGLREEFVSEMQMGQVSFHVREERAIIAVVGDGMKGKPGVAGKLFQTLGADDVNIDAIAQDGSERSISMVIDAGQKMQALQAIHDGFYKKEKTVHLVVLGCGGVGATLLERICTTNETLLAQGVRVLVCGIADSKHMLIDRKGIELATWREQLKQSPTPSKVDELAWELERYKFTNTVVVDCTASEEVAKQYVHFVKAGAHVVSANKKGNAVSMHDYTLLRTELAAQQKHFLYETNVGGGLPLLSSLRRLLESGDTITSIEAVLSGTLSYLMNTYDGSVPWSELVAQAQKEGLTEPDPRDDLFGMDVARKLLIIVRELGAELEMQDIVVEGLVPPQCATVPKEKFLGELAKCDGDVVARLKAAQANKKLFRFVARYEKREGKPTCHVGLEEVAEDHALSRLRGTDNMLIVTSALYNKTPLVIQGPGAGRDVTAAGVLADIMKLTKYLV